MPPFGTFIRPGVSAVARPQMRIIYPDEHQAQTPHTWPDGRLRGLSHRAQQSVAAREQRRATIRASRHWIAGYAGVFYAPHTDGGFFAKRCFDRAVCGSLVLLLNHESGTAGDVYARTDNGTMLAEVDRVGLWIEAAVNSAIVADAVARGLATGLSLEGLIDRTGRAVSEVRGLWEISILAGRAKPKCAQTWITSGARAVDRRAGLLAAHRRVHPYG